MGKETLTLSQFSITIDLPDSTGGTLLFKDGFPGVRRMDQP